MSQGAPLDLEAVLLRLDAAIRAAGSQRAFCQTHGISEGTLSDTLRLRHNPGDRVLAAIGLRREVVTIYRVVAPAERPVMELA